MLFFIFFDKNGDAESEELAKTVVTFDKNERKEVLKHTVNDFKKQNVLVRTIVTKYRKHN